MELDDLIADLRPRNRWQAIDFGCSLARHHYVQLVLTSIVLILPITCVVSIFLPGYLFWLIAVIWWLKPFWERTHLFVLSRSLFGARPTIRETLRGLPAYGFRELGLWLTIRRLSPTRSFDLPVTMLEGPKARERSKRLTVLHRGAFSEGAFWLATLCLHIESFLALGLLLLFQVMIPESLGIDLIGGLFGSEEAPQEGARILIALLVVAAYVMVAPYYVACGFSLYLHRRTILEGWDLELAFRRLGARAKQRMPSHARRVALLALTCGLAQSIALGLPDRARASDLTPTEAHASIEEILAGDDFHTPETIQLPSFMLDWRLDDSADEESRVPQWVRALTDFLAGSLEVLIVALALAAVAWALFRVMRDPRFRRFEIERLSRRPVQPAELFGLEITDESLPDRPAEEARRLLQRGEIRAALALLYRSTLSRLTTLYGADFSDGVTEGECLVAAQSLIPPPAGHYFENLTTTWLRCAYGHRDPNVDRLEILCGEWNQWFEAETAIAAEDSDETRADDER